MVLLKVMFPEPPKNMLFVPPVTVPLIVKVPLSELMRVPEPMVMLPCQTLLLVILRSAPPLPPTPVPLSVSASDA